MVVFNGLPGSNLRAIITNMPQKANLLRVLFFKPFSEFRVQDVKAASGHSPFQDEAHGFGFGNMHRAKHDVYPSQVIRDWPYTVASLLDQTIMSKQGSLKR